MPEPYRQFQKNAFAGFIQIDWARNGSPNDFCIEQASGNIYIIELDRPRPAKGKEIPQDKSFMKGVERIRSALSLGYDK